MGGCCSQDAYLYRETLSDLHVNKPKRNLFKTDEEKIQRVLKYRVANDSIFHSIDLNAQTDIPVFYIYYLIDINTHNQISRRN